MAKKKIAVIGSGIGGLAASWLLGAEHEVTLFESQNAVGMDAHSVPVPLPDGSTKRIDVPLRVFSEQYYPHLTSLYREVGVEYVPENYSGSFSWLDKTSNACYFAYSNLILGSVSLPYISLRQLFSSEFLRILYEFLYFHYKAPQHVSAGEVGDITILQYLQRHKYSDAFIHKFFMPIMCAICTCSYEAMGQYPALMVIHYLLQRFMYGVRRAKAGTQQVVSKLSSRCGSILVNERVKSVVWRGAGRAGGVAGGAAAGVLVTSASGEYVFDEVVLATQAHQAASLLAAGNPTDATTQAQLHILRQVPYERTRVALHTDPHLMPQHTTHWRPVNFTLAPGSPGPMATIWLNAVGYGSSRHPTHQKQLFQTWNPLLPIAPHHLIAESDFDRPVVTLASQAALRQLPELQGQNHIWFCGSYSQSGLPLLENAVGSAVWVSQALGVRCPWAPNLPLSRSLPFFSSMKVNNRVSLILSRIRFILSFAILLVALYIVYFMLKM